jgi:hypothetical protein
MADISKLSLDKLRELRNKSYNVAIAKLKELAPKGSSWLYNAQRKDDSDGLNNVRLLLNQFHYGIEAKNELLQRCVELGWIDIS